MLYSINRYIAASMWGRAKIYPGSLCKIRFLTITTMLPSLTRPRASVHGSVNHPTVVLKGPKCKVTRNWPLSRLIFVTYVWILYLKNVILWFLNVQASNVTSYMHDSFKIHS